jgi:uncharacterized OB-fold protein
MLETPPISNRELVHGAITDDNVDEDVSPEIAKQLEKELIGWMCNDCGEIYEKEVERCKKCKPCSKTRKYRTLK